MRLRLSGRGRRLAMLELERLGELGDKVLEPAGVMLIDRRRGGSRSKRGSRSGVLVRRLASTKEAKQVLKTLETVLRSSLTLLLLLLLAGVLIGNGLSSLLLGDGRLSKLVLLDESTLLLEASLVELLQKGEAHRARGNVSCAFARQECTR